MISRVDVGILVRRMGPTSLLGEEGGVGPSLLSYRMETRDEWIFIRCTKFVECRYRIRVDRDSW